MTGKEKIVDAIIAELQQEITCPIYKAWSNVPEDQVFPGGVIVVEAEQVESLNHPGVKDVKIPIVISGQTFPDDDPDSAIIEELGSLVTAACFTLNLVSMKAATALEIVGCTDAVITYGNDEASRTFTATFNLFICDFQP